jgi:uncharacterized protein (DUF1684 family)
MTKTPAVRTVESLTRLTNSANDNPRYRVHFTDGSSAITSSDAGFCYGINNPDMRGEVDVYFTRAGRIEHMAPHTVSNVI